MKTRDKLSRLESGECRLFGDNVHVYCFAPMVTVDGKYVRKSPLYRVVTAEREYDRAGSEDTAKLIDTLTGGER